MRFFLLLALTFTAVLAASPEREAKLRRMRRRSAQEAIRWKNTPPYRPITDYDRTTLGVFEASAFSYLSPQGQAAVDRLTSRGRPGSFSVGGSGKIEQLKAFEVLRDINGAKESLADIWGDQPRQPGDPPRRAGAGVFGSTVGPDAIADMVAKTLQREGREITDRRVRKDYRCMSKQERDKYHGAVNLLKESLVNNTNAYDVFAVLHTFTDSPNAHFGPAFLPWHRHYLWLYEEALNQVEPGVTLPYWDSSHEATLDNPLAASLWKDDFLGTANGEVRAGPFANWRTPVGDILRRRVNGDLQWVYNDESFEAMMDPDTFFDTFEVHELEHNGPHNYVDGHLSNLDTAAMEPIFYMHHAFVDCQWEEWRELKQYPQGNAETDYPTDEQLAELNLEGHGITEPLLPFRVNTGYGLRRVYTQLYYRCQPRGTCPGNVCGEDGYGGPNCIPRPPDVVETTTTARTTRSTFGPARTTPAPVTSSIPPRCRTSGYRPRYCNRYYTTTRRPSNVTGYVPSECRNRGYRPRYCNNYGRK